jgi:hypothetical protein
MDNLKFKIGFWGQSVSGMEKSDRRGAEKVISAEGSAALYF